MSRLLVVFTCVLLLLQQQQQQQAAAFRIGPLGDARVPELQQRLGPAAAVPSASLQQQQQHVAVVPQAASTSSSSSSTAAAAAAGSEELLNGPLPVDLRGKTAFVAGKKETTHPCCSICCIDYLLLLVPLLLLLLPIPLLLLLPIPLLLLLPLLSLSGVADSNGYGWAICKLLRAAGARVLVGTWPPVYSIFKKGIEGNRFQEDSSYAQEPAAAAAAAEAAAKMVDMQFARVYPLDAVFDAPEDVPPEVCPSSLSLSPFLCVSFRISSCHSPLSPLLSLLCC